jgi:hypothetical protein
VQNLADRFDGVAGSATHMFDVNAWAREFYYESNAHLVPTDGNLSGMYEDLFVNVTEMTLGGFITKAEIESPEPEEEEEEEEEEEDPGEPDLFPKVPKNFGTDHHVEKHKAKTQKWTVLDDPKIDNVGSDDFNLEKASEAP